MYFNFYYLFLFLRKYIKQKNMRLLLTFIIFILGGFYTFGKESCCEQCCEYLGNCCKKGKEEENGKENKEEKEIIKNLVNPEWLKYKEGKEGPVLKIFKKEKNGNEYKSGNITINLKKENDKTEITKLKDVGKNLKANTKKWALFKIIYKEKKEEGEEEKTVYLYCSNIENYYLYGIFSHCQQHVSISVIACDTSGVTDMFCMFSGCSFLKELNLSKFDTKNVTDMSNMFSYCSSLTELDLSNFNTEKVINMSHMFSGCSFLKELNLSKFDTKNVTNMSNMFSHCSSLKELDLSKFDTKKVTKMSFMFFECSSLMKLDLSNFNTDNVTYMFCMFDKCVSLHTVTFNNNLNEDIKQQLNNLGFTEKVKEEGNKITLGKKNN